MWETIEPLYYKEDWLLKRQDVDRPGMLATLLTPLLNIFRILCLLCIGVYTIYAWNFLQPHLFSVLPPLSTTLTWAGILALLVFPYYFLKNFQYGVLNHKERTHPVFYALAVFLGAGCIGISGYLLCTVGNLLSGSLVLVIATCVLVYTWFLSSMFLADKSSNRFQAILSTVSFFLVIDIGVELARNMLLAPGTSGGIFLGHMLAFVISLTCLSFFLIFLIIHSVTTIRNEYIEQNNHAKNSLMIFFSVKKHLYIMPMTNGDADILDEVITNLRKSALR